MTFRQFIAYVDGWNKANGGKEQLSPPTEEEFQQIKEQQGDA